MKLRVFASMAAVILACVSGIANAAPAIPAVKPLGSPTASTAQLVVTTPISIRAYVEYGPLGTYNGRTTTVSIAAKRSFTFKLVNLPSSSTITYRLRYAVGSSKLFRVLPKRTLQTSAPLNPNVFAIQADPHMDENSSAEVYRSTLQQVLRVNPTFLMDLGDVFMVDKLQQKTDANIRARYEYMKDFYSVLDGKVPLKFILGNHDGELGYSTFNTKQYRAEYFPELTSELSYYSFTGPDSLFVALDPFTFTTDKPAADGWAWTLGKTQYDWLQKTLSDSTAKHKFVFIHHLLQGDAASRGGIEIATFNEWGGNNRDGSYGFDVKRPGWGKPVHQVLLDYGVDFVFKGHDHLYVHQELDGIVYQTLPQPSHAGDKVNPLQYGYAAGKAVGGSGFLKVTTSDTDVRVQFIKSDGTIADEYVKSAA